MRELEYDAYRHTAQDCDVALWRPTSRYGQAIAFGTRGPYSHAMGVVLIEGQIWLAGYEEGRDGFLSRLSSAVRKYPGKIDVFRYPMLEDADRVRHHLIADLTGEYQWRNIRFIALQHFLLGRLLASAPLYREMLAAQCRKRTSAVCSQHVARAFRAGAGVRFSPVEEALESPNDIYRSGRLLCLGTLTWPKNWKR